MPDIETRADIDALMHHFYALVIHDDVIGYLFTDVAKLDLAKHLPIIGDFWESVLFNNGVYQRHGRNPMQVHAALHLKSPLLPEHFRRWLHIFTTTVDALYAGQRANMAKMRATTIAHRMLNFVSGTPFLLT